uniref:Uncharacterized protein n=1 Tax=Canis lupus familiaris TaxID=9615 RepID=A0A8C0RI57_CANLF
MGSRGPGRGGRGGARSRTGRGRGVAGARAGRDGSWGPGRGAMGSWGPGRGRGVRGGAGALGLGLAGAAPAPGGRRPAPDSDPAPGWGCGRRGPPEGPLGRGCRAPVSVELAAVCGPAGSSRLSPRCSLPEPLRGARGARFRAGSGARCLQEPQSRRVAGACAPQERTWVRASLGGGRKAGAGGLRSEGSGFRGCPERAPGLCAPVPPTCSHPARCCPVLGPEVSRRSPCRPGQESAHTGACSQNTNRTCEECLRNVSCLWCHTNKACLDYPVSRILPPSSLCKLSSARWGVCWGRSSPLRLAA